MGILTQALEDENDRLRLENRLLKAYIRYEMFMGKSQIINIQASVLYPRPESELYYVMEEDHIINIDDPKVNIHKAEVLEDIVKW